MTKKCKTTLSVIRCPLTGIRRRVTLFHPLCIAASAGAASLPPAGETKNTTYVRILEPAWPHRTRSRFPST